MESQLPSLDFFFKLPLRAGSDSRALSVIGPPLTLDGRVVPALLGKFYLFCGSWGPQGRKGRKNMGIMQKTPTTHTIR